MPFQSLTTFLMVAVVAILQKRIEEGIRYLYGVPGKPKNGPYSGSGQYANCGRVSCSYNSAIWWCNMNSYTLELHSYRQIADAAKQVVEICNTGNDVAGRVKMEGNWAVIVAKASC
ncbi:hypothetical protein B0T20DRAFT_353409 [Sordaria brevicollis]|uniref:Uncharacterized protein n=1 Tax=Sordaria brevicollis TaxID=83679 RepID=A0AAE0PEZ5_SORBR|nr:hypothetical protein B0T20DRAFT_353409 [Sordaria brevicollis]